MKNNKKFMLALVIFSLVGQVAWVVENMYLNVFIYKMFNASAEAISSMVGASAVAATVTTLLVGAFSDKVGKRKIFICGGYILWGISILGFAAIRADWIRNLNLCVTLTIALDCLMTFFGSSANDAAFNAWLTDSTDETNRGKVEGINSMMPLVAILVVFGGFMGLNQDLQESWTVIFCVIGGVVLLLGIAGIFLIEDSNVKTEGNGNYFANIFYGFRPDVIKGNLRLYLALIVFALFNIAIQIYMPYLILYYSVSLGLSNYVLIMAPAIILAAVFTAVYGRVYDKKGFGFAVVPVMALLMAGFAGLYLFKNVALVFVGSLLMMGGYLAGMAVFGALIRDYTPANKAGMFQGLRICFQVLLPGIIGPAIGAGVLKNADMILNGDGTYSFVPNENIFLAAFVAAAVTVVALLPLCKMIKKK
jgi:MFS family permease